MISSTLKKWLDERGLNLSELFSLAFIPSRTFDEIMDGKRRIPGMMRLALLTELDEFTVSEEELENYQSTTTPGKKRNDSLDLAIATHFINVWRQTKQTPDAENALYFSKTRYKHKAEHAEFLKKKYFKEKDGVFTLTPRKKETSDSKEPDVYGQAREELMRVANLSPDEQRDYMRKHGDSIKSLFGAVHVLMQKPDPVEAFSDLKKASEKNIF